jgi:hypothetical protein
MSTENLLDDEDEQMKWKTFKRRYAIVAAGIFMIYLVAIATAWHFDKDKYVFPISIVFLGWGQLAAGATMKWLIKRIWILLPIMFMLSCHPKPVPHQPVAVGYLQGGDTIYFPIAVGSDPDPFYTDTDANGFIRWKIDSARTVASPADTAPYFGDGESFGKGVHNNMKKFKAGVNGDVRRSLDAWYVAGKKQIHHDSLAAAFVVKYGDTIHLARHPDGTYTPLQIGGFIPKHDTIRMPCPCAASVDGTSQYAGVQSGYVIKPMPTGTTEVFYADQHHDPLILFLLALLFVAVLLLALKIFFK